MAFMTFKEMFDKMDTVQATLRNTAEQKQKQKQEKKPKKVK